MRPGTPPAEKRRSCRRRSSVPLRLRHLEKREIEDRLFPAAPEGDLRRVPFALLPDPEEDVDGFLHRLPVERKELVPLRDPGFFRRGSRRDGFDEETPLLLLHPDPHAHPLLLDAV